MSRGYRQERIGEEIRKIISGLLLHGLKDPRLNSLISISAVEVTRDYSYATVYFSVLGADSGEDVYAETMEGFKSSAGFIRREIGNKIRMKHVPELIFKPDRSEEYGRHIDTIIDTLEYSDSVPEEDKDAD